MDIRNAKPRQILTLVGYRNEHLFVRSPNEALGPEFIGHLFLVVDNGLFRGQHVPPRAAIDLETGILWEGPIATDSEWEPYPVLGRDVNAAVNVRELIGLALQIREPEQTALFLGEDETAVFEYRPGSPTSSSGPALHISDDCTGFHEDVPPEGPGAFFGPSAPVMPKSQWIPGRRWYDTSKTPWVMHEATLRGTWARIGNCTDKLMAELADQARAAQP